MTTNTRLLAILILLRFEPYSSAATMKPETLAAWDAYLQAANDKMQARLQPGAHFLWLDEEPDRAEKIRKGPYIAPAVKDIPRKVPSGLIHDWLGVGFVPNAKIEDILRIVRDYDRYKDIYRPGVIDSAFRRTDGTQDFFFMRLANRSVVAKTALDTEGVSSYTRVDDTRWYGVSNTTEIREIDKFGTEEQRKLPPDEGTGLIWRLSSITRLEERRRRRVRGVGSDCFEPRYSRCLSLVRDADCSPRLKRLARHVSASDKSSHRRSHAAPCAGSSVRKS
jgi:hypothetical protein